MCACVIQTQLCVCGNSAFIVIEREREREREGERGGGRDRASMDRVVSIWLASCTNKELFVPQEAGGESSPLRLRDSGELKDSLSV